MEKNVYTNTLCVCVSCMKRFNTCIKCLCAHRHAHTSPRVGRGSDWNQGSGSALKHSKRANSPTELWLNCTGIFPGHHRSPVLCCGGLPRIACAVCQCTVNPSCGHHRLLHINSAEQLQLCLCSTVTSSTPQYIEWIIYIFLKKEHWLGEDSNRILRAKEWILGWIAFFWSSLRQSGNRTELGMRPSVVFYRNI